MTDTVKALQQLAEAGGGMSTLDWSTVSHTHGKNAVGVNAVDINTDMSQALNLIRQLQQLPQPSEVSPMEWSTVSHTHGK